MRCLEVGSQVIDPSLVVDKSGFINSIDSNNGIAMQLCQYQQYFGDWRELFHELDNINKVTPEDIQRVAKEYLTEENRVVVMMNTAKS